MMKATGIVRKIDNLGRVVIPKEIRSEMKIDNGNTLEIFVDKDETVILKKYSPVREISDINDYIETLVDTTDCSIMITDTDRIVASSSDLEEYSKQQIGKEVKKAMEKRKSLNLTEAIDQDICTDFRAENEELGSLIINPILKQGDVLGTIILSSREKELGDFEEKISNITARVISKKLGL